MKKIFFTLTLLLFVGTMTIPTFASNSETIIELQKVDWNQLAREMDAYTYQKIYNTKSVEEFRQKEYNKKYRHLDEIHRPPFHQFTLDKAIKSLYELKD